MANLVAQYLEVSNEEVDMKVNELEVQTVFAEVEDADKEAKQVEQDIEEMEEVEEGLESIMLGLEASMKEGGLVPQAAVGYDLAIASYTKRVGLESEMPSLESFDGVSGRESATQLSMESVKDTIKRIWNAIKAAVSKAIQSVKNFFAKLFGGVDKVIKKLEDLEKKLDEDKDKDKVVKKSDGKPVKMKVPYVETLRHGTAYGISDIQKGLENLKGLVSDSDAINKNIETTYNDIHNTLKARKAAKSQEGMDAVANMLAKTTEDGKKGGQNVFDGLIDRYKNKGLPGNYVLVSTAEQGKAGSESLGTNIRLEQKAGTGPLSKVEEVDVPSISDVKALVKTTIEILEEVKDEDKAIKAIQEEREKVVKAADDIYKDAKDDNGAEEWIDHQLDKRLMRAAGKDLTGFIRQQTNFCFKVARAVISYTETVREKYETKK